MHLEQLTEHVYYLASAVNCVIVKTSENNAVLIDTGQDKNYGRNLRKSLDSLGLRAVAIINTHSHADHYGGNDYLLRQYDNAQVYAPGFEAAIIQNPYLEPVYLFNGAKPLNELMSKWLMAKASHVDHILRVGKLLIDDFEFEIIDTSGHAHSHYSVLVDGVLLAADAIFGFEVFEKYPMPFGQDIGKQITSCQKLLDYDCDIIVPGHGSPTSKIKDLVGKNIEIFNTVLNTVKDSCNGGSTEDVLEQTCHKLSINLADIPRYYLNLCTIQAYLSYLRETGKIELSLVSNRLNWVQV